MKENFILITGAGSGFGKALANEFAQKGFNLFLVSLHEHELKNVKEEIFAKHPQLIIETLAINLTEHDAHLKIKKYSEEGQFKIKGLVNNVGLGYVGKYEKFEPSFFQTMIQLNVNLTHNLTNIYLKELLNNKPAYILNVSSISGFYAVPYKTVYTATKAFILNYSRSLYEEFKDKGLTVSCVAPGGMFTSDLVRKRIAESGWRKLFIAVDEPENVARDAVKGLLNKEAVIIPSSKDRFLNRLSRLIPKNTMAKLMGDQARKTFKED